MDPNDIKTGLETAKDLGVPIEKLSDNALSKPTTELGEGFGNLFWLIFSPIHAARAALEPRINGFQKRIEEKVAQIPEEQRVEPPLNIVGPALEAAKYYITDENIQEMFAELIASSVDASKESNTHPSYIEIIKQLSPLDARIVTWLSANRRFPVVKLVMYDRLPKLGETIEPQVASFVEDFMPLPKTVTSFPEITKEHLHSINTAIENLQRLSIIKVKYDDPMAGTSFARPQIAIEISNIMQGVTTMDYPKNSAIVQHGYWDFTAFGEGFIKCCITNVNE